MRALFATARIAHLATVRPDGSPHIVPCVFALEGDTLVTSVDRKPKRSAALQRTRNIEHQPHVSLLADRYDEDWERLWWVRADGTARVIDGGPAFERALSLLAAKYAQYEGDPGSEIVIEVAIDRWVGWRWR